MSPTQAGTTPITRYEDIIDSRQIIERIEWLEALEYDSRRSQFDPTDQDIPMDDDDREELAALRELAAKASGSPDWQYGETLIRDSYFQTYAEDLAEDIGAIRPELANRWPYTCIDWERAARELQYDYSSVDFDGITYWIRS